MSVAIIFSIVIFSMLGVIQFSITKEIDKEYRPIFGSEVQFDIPYGSSWTEDVITSLKSDWYRVARVRSLNTTLLWAQGNTYGVQLITYDGDFPHYARLDERIITTWQKGASVTPWVLPIVMSGMLMIDQKSIPVTHEILDTTIGWFAGFGGDTGKVILSHSFLSGSSLFGWSSRFSDSVLISPRDQMTFDRVDVSEKIESAGFKPRFIDARSDRLLERVNEVFSVITAVFVAILLSSGIIIHSLSARIRDRLTCSYRQFFLLGMRSSRIVYGEIFLHMTLLIISSILASAIMFILFVWVSSISLPIVFDGEWVLAATSRATLLICLVYISILFFLRIGHGLLSRRSKIGLIILFASIIACIVALLFPTLFALWVFLIACILFFIFGWGIVSLYRFLGVWVMKTRLSFGIRDGIRTLSRRWFPAVFLTLSFFLSALLIVSVGGLSASFYQTLQSSDDLGVQLFALNITSRDYESLNVARLIDETNSYPIIRGRITQINKQSLIDHLNGSDTWEFRREFNITPQLAPELLHSGDIPSWAYIWVDEEFADRLGVKIGDSIEFLVAGRNITLEVSALYESVRSGVTPFFYFRVDPEFFSSAPRSYFATFETNNIEETKARILKNGSSAITFIDVSGVVKQIQIITSDILRVLWVVSMLFVIALAGALYTLFADYRSREEIRFRQYRLLGASRFLLDEIRLTTRIVPIGLSIWSGIIIGMILLWWLFARVSLIIWDIQSQWIIIAILFALFSFYAIFLIMGSQTLRSHLTHTFHQWLRSLSKSKC
jgi:hypothetical protein